LFTPPPPPPPRVPKEPAASAGAANGSGSSYNEEHPPPPPPTQTPQTAATEDTSFPDQVLSSLGLGLSSSDPVYAPPSSLGGPLHDMLGHTNDTSGTTVNSGAGSTPCKKLQTRERFDSEPQTPPRSITLTPSPHCLLSLISQPSVFKLSVNA
jgi:hypothetical protein